MAASRRAIGTTAARSRGATLTNAVPPAGSRLDAATWLLANAAGKSVAIPITSPVDRISGPSTMSTPGNFANGNTASFTETYRGTGSAVIPWLLERPAHHHPRRRLRQVQPGRLRDERHRARRPRVDLQDVDLAVLHGELDVHQPADLQRLGQGVGLLLELARRSPATARTAGWRRRSRPSGCRPPRCAPSRRRRSSARRRRPRRRRPRWRPRGTCRSGSGARGWPRRPRPCSARGSARRRRSPWPGRPARSWAGRPPGSRSARRSAAPRRSRVAEALGGCSQPQALDHQAEPLAVLGQVDRLGARADDRHARRPPAPAPGSAASGRRTGRSPPSARPARRRSARPRPSSGSKNSRSEVS